MKVTSAAFAANGKIPARHTCDGQDVSPPLEWSGTPATARSFALVCSDPDAPAGTWYHWAIYDIPAGMTSLREHFPAAGGDKIRQALNDFGQAGYGGPCPPPGHGTHHYHFTLFALDAEKLPVAPKARAREVERAAKAHSLGSAELVAVYSR